MEDVATRSRQPLPRDLAALIAERFRALGDPTRLELLDRLHRGEATVHELTDLVGSTQQNVSKHLGVLYQAGLVDRRKDGNFVRYAVTDAAVFELCDSVCGSLRRQLDARRRAVTGAGI
jgi:DNA-binding transcriptional ArsR family regulator